MRNGTRLAITVLTVAEVPNLYSGLLPSLWTIGHFSGREREEALFWIRRGEIMGTVMALAIGIAAASISQTNLPLVGTVVMAAFLVANYEHALRNPTSAVGWEGATA